MDFFSEKELVTQTGHARSEWPLVFLKECIDNSLDACDEANIVPVITVKCDAGGIEVSDNGPGLPEETLERQKDFTVRASNREAYQAPDRGAQGNAIKTLLPMPSIIDPAGGKLVIEAHGKRHSIRCRADHVTQRPMVDDEATTATTTGTRVRMEWSPQTTEDAAVWPFDRKWASNSPQATRLVHDLVLGFTLFNPHATVSLDWFGDQTTFAATDAAFSKWRPCQPTSAHWYDTAQLERLVGAYITHDRDTGNDRLVSDFLSEFDGFAGSAKRTAVLTAAGLKRSKLSELVAGGDFNHKAVEELLQAMQANAKPVSSRRLGVIGEDHLRQRFVEIGCDPASITYRKSLAREGKPYVVEVVFGQFTDEQTPRHLFTGANWSAAIKNAFRSFGATGEGLEGLLVQQEVWGNQPVAMAVHLAAPHVRYTDRGKTSIVVDDVNETEDQDDE
jgi:DNA topoisomerase VI subunit B